MHDTVTSSCWHRNHSCVLSSEALCLSKIGHNPNGSKRNVGDVFCDDICDDICAQAISTSVQDLLPFRESDSLLLIDGAQARMTFSFPRSKPPRLDQPRLLTVACPLAEIAHNINFPPLDQNQNFQLHQAVPAKSKAVG